MTSLAVAFAVGFLCAAWSRAEHAVPPGARLIAARPGAISWRVTAARLPPTKQPENGARAVFRRPGFGDLSGLGAERFAAVETVGFDYGQRHRVELDCRIAVFDRLRREFPRMEQRLGDDHLIDLGVLGRISDTALTRDTVIAFAKSGLPNTFVPGRNLMFFSFAAALGYRRGARHLVGGMCETDYSGYPDCRDDTLKSLQVSLSLGMDRRFVIHTPLMRRDKAATWALALDSAAPRSSR